jgi:hypothetical protein
MTDSPQPQTPKPVELDPAGYYVLPIAEAFVDLMPPRGEEKA